MTQVGYAYAACEVEHVAASVGRDERACSLREYEIGEAANSREECRREYGS
jgi:hypothetical protein